MCRCVDNEAGVEVSACRFIKLFSDCLVSPWSRADSPFKCGGVEINVLCEASVAVGLLRNVSVFVTLAMLSPSAGPNSVFLLDYASCFGRN